MKYEVSVVIPAYNAEKFILRSLNSLQNQSLQAIEIIVVDDGSSDGTLEICRQASQKDSRIKVFHKKNEGQGIARNFGISKANGKYIGFVDADDYVEPDMYETLFSAAQKYQADMVYSYAENEEFWYEQGFHSTENGMLLNEPWMILKMKTILMGGLPAEKEDSFLGMSVWRSLYSLSVIRENQLFFLSERIVNSEDLLFNLDYVSHCKTVITVNRVFYHYCKDNPVSFSVRANKDRYMMFKRMYHEQEKRCSDEEQILRAKRRFLANVRVAIVEKVRWTSLHNFWEQKKSIKDIVTDTFLADMLRTYPIRELPFKQKVFFYFMIMKQPVLLIILSKLRYRFL